MAGSPLATSARFMRLRTPFLVLVLLLLSGQLYATEQSAGADEAASGTPPPVRMIKPTRESIYTHLMTEMEAALGAEEHIKGVFSRLADGLQTALSATVIPSLQAMVDTVLQKAEDTWVTADDAGKASAVRPCVDGAENDAQQVAKRALEKAEGCIRSLEDEGQRRIRQAARLLNEIEDVSKRFVTALEACVKEEEAKEAAQSPAGDSASASAPAEPEPEPAKAPGDPDTDVAVTEGPGKCLKASSDAAGVSGEKPARCPHSKGEDAAHAAQEEAATGEGPGAGQKKKPCAKCKKAQEEAAKKATAGDASQEEANAPEETENVESAEEKEGKYGKENKGKKGKEWKDNKGKDKSGKGKREDSANVDETVNGKGSEKSKEKGKDKNKKGKDGEAIDKAGKESEKAEKKSKGSENEETTSTEETSGETKGKKGKKQDKKEGKVKKEKGGESGESKKSRKKRDLLAVNEKPDAVPQPSSNSAATSAQEAPSSEGSPASAPSEDPWPTEGSTPEERRVIACLRSATLQPLLEEKTRTYQRLQGVLQRTAEKEQEAPTCVDEHVHKAELKIAAIKQRMGSCADRKMRQEL